MVEQTQAPESEDIVPVEISAEEYMATYAEDHHEWAEGVLIKMAPVTGTHDELTDYLRDLLKAYLALTNQIAKIRSDPFVMRLEESRREPDIQVILQDNLSSLKETHMDGAADICIEVVSRESVGRDYGDKLHEYESNGVREYWIIDPIREVGTFYRLGENGKFTSIQPDENNDYTTPLLPKFKLHVSTLWQDALPNMLDIVEAVRKMVEPPPS